jgi:hypothetical protein
MLDDLKRLLVERRLKDEATYAPVLNEIEGGYRRDGLWEKALADSTIEGFNIGMNCGEVAGQTVFHCHVHLIPRRRGDVENPRGGVRRVIAGKGNYSVVDENRLSKD